VVCSARNYGAKVHFSDGRWNSVAAVWWSAAFSGTTQLLYVAMHTEYLFASRDFAFAFARSFTGRCITTATSCICRSRTTGVDHTASTMLMICCEVFRGASRLLQHMRVQLAFHDKVVDRYSCWRLRSPR